VAAVDAPNQRTVVISLKEPWAPLLADLSHVAASILPARLVRERGKAFWNAPVGSGPFVLERWVKGSGVVLIRNPAYCPETLLPLAQVATPHGQPGYLPESRERMTPTDQIASGTPPAPPARKRARIRRPHVKALTPSAVIRRLKLGQQGLSCCIDHFGSEAPECSTEGSVVYLNRDHPLHQQFAKDRRAYALYLARLLTQEIALMKQPKSPRQAFERQSRLLRDAFCNLGSRVL